VKQRNWIKNIKLCIAETRALYVGKVVIVEVSEPLRDLLLDQMMFMSDAEAERGDYLIDGDETYLFGCRLVVSNQIPTYRIFVET
jgi:hypothetical protein